MKRRDFLEHGSWMLGAAAAQPVAGNTVPRAIAPHPDWLTNANGYEYWLVGNSRITVALQTAATGVSGTHGGLLLSCPEHFCRKQSTYLYHERTGLELTRVGLLVDGTMHRPTPVASRIEWEYPAGIPTIRVEWSAAGFDVVERLWCPAEESALVREIEVRGGGERGWTLVAPFTYNRIFFDETEEDTTNATFHASGYRRLDLFALTPAKLGFRRLECSSSPAVLIWSLDWPAASVRERGLEALRADTAAWWKRRATFTSSHAGLNHLFRQAQKGIRCSVASNGKMDAGPMQYNGEWVRDSVAVACGATLTGMPEVGEAILERDLQRAVSEDGRTVDSSSHRPDNTIELDQNGELLHALHAHWLWTGNDRLMRAYWPRIRKVADFVLRPVFSFPETGLVKNEREFWERSAGFGVRDGYELSYQAWNVVGLETASEMARYLNDHAAAGRWMEASRRMKQAMLSHPTLSLIEDGRFIKRRLPNGKPQFTMEPPDRQAMPVGMPLRVEPVSYCDPDTTMALPFVLGIADPAGELARKTMEAVEKLWNQRWTGGGYGRYDVTSEPDSPGPWPFATLFVMRAYAEMGDWDKVWRGVDWLLKAQGARAGTWFEFYGERPSPPLSQVSYIIWNWAEIVMFLVAHLLGVTPRQDGIHVRPRLAPGLDKMEARLLIRGRQLTLRLARDKGRAVPVQGLRLPYLTSDTTVELRCS